jgi:hypothetical protein
MTDLMIPKGEPRVPARKPDELSAYVKSEDTKSINTWGIPNNLFRTMAWHPRLALTEVDYANSFIFDQRSYASWPSFVDNGKSVMFPQAGFVDRVTKELVINLVSLLNRSRYSITHHTVIAYLFLSQEKGKDHAEQLLLNLVDEACKPAFENKTVGGQPLYSSVQLHALRLAVKLCGDAHDVTDEEFKQLRGLMEEVAKQQLGVGTLTTEPASKTREYVNAYVNAMLVELTWCIVHFAGLLNKWFTVLKVLDEPYRVTGEKEPSKTFAEVYNENVPESIKKRNNALLGTDGWGGR